ncbi:MAG: biopolymer transporter ExbD [Sulfitobacter sp.]
MFSFASPRQRRKPSLTPMIDVVFLLLVFFMLASQFGQDNALPLSSSGGASSSYSGPPRLVDIGGEELRLNGVVFSEYLLVQKLGELVGSDTDMVILRGSADATLQRMIDVAQALRAAGFENLSVVE